MIKPFVDRTEEMKRLNQALKYNGQESPVLVFTGIGGIGKTALRIAFEDKVLIPNRVPYAVLDYDGDPNLRPIEATLRAIRRQLGRHKVKTPVFDFLYARYFELSMGIKLSPNNCPPELDAVATVLDGIPVVGNVTQILYGLSRLGLRLKERVQHKEWLYRLRELEPREVLNTLPEVLAEDLEEAISSQSLEVLKSFGSRITLFVDAYERLSESQIDDTLHRKLLLLTPHLVRVIFTRDQLPWEHKYPKEWRGKIEHFPPLEVLSPEDAKTFLWEKSINNPDLQDHLYQLTGGFPFHLELCTDICREIEETTKREPGIQDFQGAAEAMNLTEELVNRLLRQLKDNERDLMVLAAYPRWFSVEVLEVLSSVPESVPRILRKFTGLSMFSSHPEIPKAYIIRKDVRNFLFSQQKEDRFWKERHGKLAKFHKERWEETQSSHHLREVIYHCFYENPEEAMKIFEEHFWKLFEKFSFGEAEGLLEAVPIEMLSEKEKRKVDYARARLLTSSLHSHDSLITAKTLYKALIASEKDEELLAKYLSCLGDLTFGTGEYVKVLESYQKALAIRLKIFGEEHPLIANSYNNIGCVYCRKGEYGKALDYHQKSLGIRLKILDKEHPDFAASYNNIGEVYFRQGEYDKALVNCQKSLSIKLKIYGEKNCNVAGDYGNIGTVYNMKREYEKALEYHHKALATFLEIYGEEHPDVASSYNNFGIVYSNQCEYEKALEYYHKALAIRLKIYGEEHPDTATSYNNLGTVYNRKREYEKALEYHHKALAIRLNVLREKHPAIADSYYNIGEVYREQSEYDKALDCHQKSLAIELITYGKKHPYIADSCAAIAHTLRALKKEEEACEKIRQSVGIYCKFSLWKKAVQGLDTLAGWQEETGNKKEAEEARMEAQKIRKEHGLS